VRAALAPDGRVIVLVPQNPRLAGSLDEVLGHRRRYTRATLQGALEAEGFALEQMFDFNRVTTPAWWFNGRVLRHRQFSQVQLKVFNVMTGMLRRLEPMLPWQGTSLVAVARRSAQELPATATRTVLRGMASDDAGSSRGLPVGAPWTPYGG
jgi:hypothetical protein